MLKVTFFFKMKYELVMLLFQPAGRQGNNPFTFIPFLLLVTPSS